MNDNKMNEIKEEIISLEKDFAEFEKEIEKDIEKANHIKHENEKTREIDKIYTKNLFMYLSKIPDISEKEIIAFLCYYGIIEPEDFDCLDKIIEDVRQNNYFGYLEDSWLFRGLEELKRQSIDLTKY